MTAFTSISGAAAAVRAKILANASSIGSVVTIKDRDEDPAIIVDNAKDLPMVCVIPLGDSPDKITFTMGGNSWLHEFDLMIVGYYRFSLDNKDPFADIATVRQYAYDTLDLFRGTNAAFYAGCNVRSATIDLGYFMVTDYILYRYDISLKCTMYEST